ncbi:glycine--tRNA ligase subunit beta [Buchnera aphidicola]|uniref:Glycine--tRNA ligase beta subunit n=1 Tax=Buchnera aphidicola (Therioaphis trifolii) TaxID=1241884 RepID=A0A4D6YK83_9GAMM|nr:glycine--tRNA ligase subunit beta [Buchnera aphidicola]QCI27101.1 glycine--tRNA ligase subunit beta [Buchnera aphidicola (Therioaphis trifolii)]
MNYKTCLVELNIEEIPSKQIRNIANQFYENIKFQLEKYKIHFYKINIFDTPRRIAIIIKKLNTSLIIKKKKYRGPSIKESFDIHGKITTPALKWLKKFNINLKDTTILSNKKGKWLLYENIKNTISIKNILLKIITFTIKNIYTSKKMKWNQYDIQFIRPIRNIIILIDNKLIKFNQFGIPSKKYLYGNIFTKFKKIKIKHAKEYENLLYKKGKVISKFNIRKKKIKYQIQKKIFKIKGKIQYCKNLLEEITCLVEWPKILLAKFEKSFLNIPQEIIIYIMKSIQKYFPIYNIYNNKLTNYFIIVANNNSKNNEKIILDNEFILNSKFSDIIFFMKQDYKIKLKEYFPLLKKIIFHEKLGTMLEKSERIIYLIKYVSKYTKSNLKESLKAAYLSKCDLNTYMAYEFPELKGIIGMYYALKDNESKDIALSIKEQYKPNFSNDTLPSNILSCTLAITEKIDTIVGLFLINKIPKNNKDPFFLRRLTIGIIRIIIEKKININIYKIIKKSINTYYFLYPKKEILKKIIKFIKDRLYIWYKKKYEINVIKSVFSCHKNNLLNIDILLKTIHKIKNNINFQNTIITYKRIFNLLKKIKINEKNNHLNYQLIQNEEEKQLFINMNNNDCMLKILNKKRKYKQAFKLLFQFNKFINNFLNKNSIKYTSQEIQKNRITLLLKIKHIFLIIINLIKI